MSADIANTAATVGEHVAAATRSLMDAKKGLHIYSHIRAEINQALMILELVAILAEQEAK